MVTIPTLDEIAGSTVMVKLRELIKKFIGFASEVDAALDDRYTKAEVNNMIETVEDEVAGKQDILTAGTGITIENNVISATGYTPVVSNIEYDEISATGQYYLIGDIDNTQNYYLTLQWENNAGHMNSITCVITAAEMAGSTPEWNFYYGTEHIYIAYVNTGVASQFTIQPSDRDVTTKLKFAYMVF